MAFHTNHRITKSPLSYLLDLSVRSQALFCLYTPRLVSSSWEVLSASLNLGDDRPSQTTRLAGSDPDWGSGLEFQRYQGGISPASPIKLSSRLPPILRNAECRGM